MNTGTPMLLKCSAITCRVTGLSGPGGASDEPVPVGEGREEEQLLVCIPGNQLRLGHLRILSGDSSG
jgi:hypothetical protein